MSDGLDPVLLAAAEHDERLLAVAAGLPAPFSPADLEALAGPGLADAVPLWLISAWRRGLVMRLDRGNLGPLRYQLIAEP